jgi:predicted nucleic acid-binding protein
MSDRFFLDTNIFVYSFDKKSPAKAERAAKLIRRAIETREGIVSYQVVQEFLNLALRRFAEPMSSAEAEQYLSTTFRPLLAVHSSHGLYGQALRLASTFSLSWYDSLIVASAIEGQCNVLYSEDFQHGQRFGPLRIENPFRQACVGTGVREISKSSKANWKTHSSTC